MLVSIVIPARAGEDELKQLLQRLPPHRDIEVIVAVENPLDADVRALQQSRRDVIWVEATRGRGLQLNAGANRAHGTWLWFLHADSRVPDQWIDAFRDVDRAPEVVGGSFAFRLDSSAWQARVLEAGVRLRVRWFGLPYGDQGLFVRRAVFHEIGGFAEIPLMEDVEFVHRLKRRGGMRHLSVQLATSARRWEREGWWTRSALNLAFLALYQLGVSPGWLSKRYDRT
jgi:rSAM/selenodomain-associated transferase 2